MPNLLNDGSLQEKITFFPVFRNIQVSLPSMKSNSKYSGNQVPKSDWAPPPPLERDLRDF